MKTRLVFLFKQLLGTRFVDQNMKVDLGLGRLRISMQPILQNMYGSSSSK